MALIKRAVARYHMLHHDERSRVVHIAQRFEHFLDTYRCPDGSPWTGQKLHEATGGVVPRSYFANLRKGRIENPGYEKMKAIAKAMGFPPEAWFEDAPDRTRAAPAEGRAPLRRRQASEDRRVLHERRGGPHERGRHHGGRGRRDEDREDS